MFFFKKKKKKKKKVNIIIYREMYLSINFIFVCYLYQLKLKPFQKNFV